MATILPFRNVGLVIDAINEKALKYVISLRRELTGGTGQVVEKGTNQPPLYGKNLYLRGEQGRSCRAKRNRDKIVIPA